MGRKRPKSEITREKRLADIDRFAGSSEEEQDGEEDDADGEFEEPMKAAAPTPAVDDDEDDEDDEMTEEAVENEHPLSARKNKKSSLSKQESSDDDDDSNNNSGDDDDDSSASEDGDEILTESAPIASGMANAMARILVGGAARPKIPNSSTAAATTTTVVLSKTKTPLQQQAAIEAQEAKALKLRKRANREKRLTAFYIPNSLYDNGKGDDDDADDDDDAPATERYHRRVATRGVVALFNAIAAHQQPVRATAAPTTEPPATTSKTDAKLDKDKFLALIKQRAEEAATAGTRGSNDAASRHHNKSSLQQKPPVQKVKWEALSDGFKTVSKKNWDEESSSDEDVGDRELVPVEED
jgi:hypothetical protein